MKRNLHAGKRQSGGFSLNVFTDEELYEIHLATLEVLQKTGLFVQDKESLEIFGGGGAVVDSKNKIVKIHFEESQTRAVATERSGHNPFYCRGNGRGTGRLP